MSKIKAENVKDIVRKGCGLAVTVGLFVLPNLDSVKNAINEVRYRGNVKYSDVISVILNSSMYSSDKTKVIEIIPKDADVELYRSVIQAVNSKMYSSDKMKVITEICGVKEES